MVSAIQTMNDSSLWWKLAGRTDIKSLMTS